MKKILKILPKTVGEINKTIGGKKIMPKNPLLSLDEIELRDLCRHHIDSFEQWSRRIIDEKFKNEYGDKYIDVEVQSGQPLIKADIKKVKNEIFRSRVSIPCR